MDILVFVVGVGVGIALTIIVDKVCGTGQVEAGIVEDITKLVNALKAEEAAVQERLKVHLKAVLSKIHP